MQSKKIFLKKKKREQRKFLKSHLKKVERERKEREKVILSKQRFLGWD